MKLKTQAAAVTATQPNTNGNVPKLDFQTLQNLDPKEAAKLLEQLRVLLSDEQLDCAVLDIMKERRNRLLSKPTARIGTFSRERARLVNGQPQKFTETYTAVEVSVGVEGRSEPLRFRISSPHKVRALLSEDVQNVLKEYLSIRDKEDMKY